MMNNSYVQKEKSDLRRKLTGSIKSRVALCFLILIATLVGMTVLLNISFLERFYQKAKLKEILNTFSVLNNAASAGDLYTDNYADTLEQISNNGNLSILVIAADGTVEISSAAESEVLVKQLQDALFENPLKGQSLVIRSENNYTLLRQTDSRFKEDYLVLVGTLGDGNTIMLRTPLESIHEAVKVSNKFLLLAGLIGVLLAMVLMAIFTRVITIPVMSLNELSRRMNNLDFNAKYIPSDRHDELDGLGENMNHLSETLKNTIQELKQANAQLHKDLEVRDQQEKMRREFMSNVSHELKTPIAVIQGYAEGLQEGIADDPESLQFYTETIIDESKRMNRMVQQMLALNKLEYGETTVSMEQFDLTQLISSVVSSQSILAENDGIRISFDDQKEEMIWADELMTEQVISNFLSNAIHYCEGEKKIRIFYTPKVNNVRVSVFNTGNPIPEESLVHLWEKFYKVDKARTREYGGSGIGLSVVKAVMDAFHQECGVINHQDGVEFWCEFDTSNT